MNATEYFARFMGNTEVFRNEDEFNGFGFVLNKRPGVNFHRKATASGNMFDEIIMGKLARLRKVIHSVGHFATYIDSNLVF